MRRTICFFCIILLLSAMVVGCSKNESYIYQSNNKSIKVEPQKDRLYFTNVAFYDFHNDKKVSSLSGAMALMSNSINTTEVLVMRDGEDNIYCIKTDVKISSKPSSFKVYTDSSKKSYDIYGKRS